MGSKKKSSLVRFQNILFTTCQISNQVSYNASAFKSKFSQRVILNQNFYNVSDFAYKFSQKNSDFLQKFAFKKSRFDWIYLVKWTNSAIFVHF